MMRCVDCREEVDPTARDVWQRVHGWERKRAQGGTNAIALREPKDVFMCGACMVRRQHGYAELQERLL